MELQMIFQLPHQPHTDFNPSHQMKQLMVKLLKHDPMIAPWLDIDNILSPNTINF